MPSKVCECCSYETKDNSNYIKHMKSKKHIQKSNMYNKITSSTSQNSSTLPETPSIQLYKCDACGNMFTRISNLTRHYKICTQNQNEIFLLKLKLKQYEKEIKQYKKEIAKHVKENECTRQLLQKLKK